MRGKNSLKLFISDIEKIISGEISISSEYQHCDEEYKRRSSFNSRSIIRSSSWYFNSTFPKSIGSVLQPSLLWRLIHCIVFMRLFPQRIWL